MNFDWINFLLNRRDKIKDEYPDIIDLINFHYRVDNVYNDLILVDLDIDNCDLERGQKILLLNKVYILRDVEFLPHKNDFKFRLTLVNIDNN